MRRRSRRRNAPPAVARSGEPRLRLPTELLRLPRRSPLYPELARALAAAARFHVLRTDLEQVPVRATATTSQSGCYRSREGDPVDVRVSRLHGRVALSFLHELGHLVDHQLGWELGPALRTASPALPSRAPAGAERSRRRYFDSPKEIWARAYAQTVLVRSGDPLLERQLLLLQDAGDAFAWPAADDEPVASAVEEVLARRELLRAQCPPALSHWRRSQPRASTRSITA